MRDPAFGEGSSFLGSEQGGRGIPEGESFQADGGPGCDFGSVPKLTGGSVHIRGLEAGQNHAGETRADDELGEEPIALFAFCGGSIEGVLQDAGHLVALQGASEGAESGELTAPACRGQAGSFEVSLPLLEPLLA